MRRLFLLLCTGILLSVTLAGCGGDENIKKAPYEDIPLEDIQGNDLNGAGADRLYQAGHTYLQAGDWKQALRVYDALQSRFPFTPLATQAALESVTAHFIHKDYAQAVAAADRFIKQHPRHRHIDYVYYLRGLANYHRNDAGILGGNPDQRDLSFLKQAFSDFKLLIQNYPNSVYAKDAQLHMVKIQNRLADFELSVAEFYLQRHAYVAAARRASYIVRHYQRSSSTPRALEIMQESYAQLGLPELARDARSIMQESYPQYIVRRDEFYRERANDFYGDDALPGEDKQALVPHEPGPVEAALDDFSPWSESDTYDPPAMSMYYKGGSARPPQRRNKKSQETKGEADAATSDVATSGATGKAAEKDEPGFFGNIWNVLTPGG